MSTGRVPWLLTPGPLTTSAATKQAMGRDWGSRDAGFIAINRRVCERLVAIAGGEGSHVAVPVQGSGTFAVEAALGTLVPAGAKALVLINGAYGQRMARILETMGRAYATLETPEDSAPDAAEVDAALAADPALTHVAAVHCETTSGILNPIAEIANVTAGRGRRLIIDAMSTFGALPLDAREVPFDAAVASANKCLEGVPGMGFAIIGTEALATSRGNAHSLSLDLFDQWTAMEGNGQWRFTPPTHVVAALDAALDQLEAEGGVAARGARYSQNCRVLTEGMRGLGFRTLLPDALQAPVIVTFLTPADAAFRFADFYAALAERGYLIYPGKLTKADSFRIGCMGALGAAEMRGVVAAVAEVIAEMGVTRTAPG